MKSIKSICIYFIAMLLCAGCYHTTICPAFQITDFTYGPFEYAGEVLIYCNTDNDSVISFYCGAVDASKARKELGLPKSCGAYAEQILTSGQDTIRYHHMAITFCPSCEPPVWIEESSNIEISIEGNFFSFGYYENDIRDETKEYARILPEWTAVDGTRYTEVYHLLDESSEVSLYLVFGYGIVQIETPDKTYYLQHENQ